MDITIEVTTTFDLTSENYVATLSVKDEVGSTTNVCLTRRQLRALRKQLKHAIRATDA